MFGHRYFGARYFGPHYFGPALDSEAGGGEDSGGGEEEPPVADSCTVTYTVEASCPSPTSSGTIGEQGPPGPPGPAAESCEWCCPLFCGTGSPEGVVESPVGGIYEQEDAAITTHPLWIKRTGTGNTGWVAWAGMRGSGAGSLAIGDNALAAGIDSIALGEDAISSGARAEAIGKNSQALADDAKAFGSGAIVRSAGSIGIGVDVSITAIATNNVVVGARSTSDSVKAIAVGVDLVVPAGNTNSIWIGSSITSVAGLAQNILIGHGVTHSGFSNSVVIGNSTIDEGGDSVVIGHSSRILGGETSSIAIGFDVKVDQGLNCTAIGCQASITGPSTTNAIAIGSAPFIFDGADGAIAIGSFSGVDINAAKAIALGYTASSSALQAIAIGYLANSLHQNSIAFGVRSRTTAANQLMIGSNAAPINEVVFNGAASGTFAGQLLAFAGSSGRGLDQVGGELRLKGGPGTGAAAAGNVVFQVATAGASSSTVQTQATIATVKRTGIDLAAGATLMVNGTRVVTAQQAHIADPAAGATIDTQSRTAIGLILDLLEAHGLMAP